MNPNHIPDGTIVQMNRVAHRLFEATHVDCTRPQRPPPAARREINSPRMRKQQISPLNHALSTYTKNVFGCAVITNFGYELLRIVTQSKCK